MVAEERMAPKRGAGAAPKRMMRPAAAKAKAGLAPPAVRIRRPAARGVDRPSQGDEKKFEELGVKDLTALGPIRIKKAKYYGREIDCAGQIVNVRMEGAELMADFKVSGTQDEGFLRAISAKADRMATLHLCGAGCTHVLTGETLLHSTSYAPVNLTGDPWYTNAEVVPGAAAVEDEDELRRLREAVDRSLEEGRRREESPKKKEKKSKKEKKTREDSLERKRKVREKEEEEEEIVRGQKGGEALYAGTGLDPLRKPRAKILKKAKRLGKSSKKSKKKKKDSDKGSGSSSSSSESDDSLVDVSGGLFESDRKIKVIADRCPGALGYCAMWEARQNLLTSAGTSWAMEKQAIAPVFVQYARQQMAAGLSPPMLQEVMTVATCLDLLLLNRPAAAVDVLGQVESLRRFIPREPLDGYSSD